MKFKSFIVILTILSFLSFIPGKAQVVRTKDGVPVGKRTAMVDSCIKWANDSLIMIKGLQVNTYKYCACLIDNLIPAVNSREMAQAEKENRMEAFLFEDKNFEILMNCIEDNTKITDDYNFKDLPDDEMSRKIGIKTCVNSLITSEESKDVFTEKTAEKYCNCAIPKLMQAGYTYKDVKQITDQNSPVHNEIAVPCLMEALRDGDELKLYNRYRYEDIDGKSPKCEVPLMDYFGKGYKVKISIGGIVKYFIFDTGASDLIIDSQTERIIVKRYFKKGKLY